MKGKDGTVASGRMNGPLQDNVVLSRDETVGYVPSITAGADAYISFHVSSSSLLFVLIFSFSFDVDRDR